MQDGFFHTITDNSVVITSTQRLAMSLTQQYIAYQQQQQLIAWPSAAIIPYQFWLEQTWQRYLTAKLQLPPLLLTDFQEQTLWENIIRQSGYGENLLRIHQTASLARNAWQQLRRFGSELSAEFDVSEDTAVFKEWALAFEEYCATKGWLNQISLVQTLITLATQQQLITNKHFILVGFIELFPQQQQLFKALATAGCTWELYKSAGVNTQVHKLGLPTQQQELAAMAQWAQQQAQANPKQMIACVITDLAAQRSEVESVFTHILAPELLLQQKTDHAAFNLVTRVALSEYSLINTALICLNLGQRLLPIEHISTLLRSPFLAGADQEMTARALLDAQVRGHGERVIEIHDILRIIGLLEKPPHTPIYAVPIMQQQLQDVLAKIKQQKNYLAPSAWADFFAQLLTLFGWPGERSLTSYEHQTKERWDQALQEFAQLTTLFAQLNYSQALEHLSGLLHSILFQPKAAQTQIHILTPSDAIALPFDKLWIMGLNDHAWPPAPRSNPFIPFSLQRRLSLPHATASQELQYYQQLLTELSQGAGEIMLSYALHSDDQELRPSALIKNIAAIEATEQLLPRLANKLFNSAPLELINDEQGPIITDNEYIKGGIGIFKQQAACPFRAFAMFRLGVRHQENPSTGLNAMERGNLVHLALEYLWKKLDSHGSLKSCPEPVLADIVQRSISKALLQLKKQRPQLMQPRFMALELKRLTKLMHQWLAFELQRPAFTVTATEQKFNYTFENIALQIRVDRIDQLGDGSHLIIDYKTGACSENAWFGERPDDPQLPFYCISTELPVSGLLYAQLNSKDVKFKGIVNLDAQTYAPANLKPVFNWSEQADFWKSTLQTLAVQFRTGYAKVDPKEIKQTCQRCELVSLCRIKDKIS